jgi:hypothetical protein
VANRALGWFSGGTVCLRLPPGVAQGTQEAQAGSGGTFFTSSKLSVRFKFLSFMAPRARFIAHVAVSEVREAFYTRTEHCDTRAAVAHGASSPTNCAQRGWARKRARALRNGGP